ncbi:hypothetical protein MJO28_015867 [Puccinia striiformis f. sp. tritici]|uniref:Uncharacterized protein n=1 Tax=Puccinia striiformis f. sp. tritici TaxID=168172 RepID=A0ACC0DQA2_9BASI|nr:hypothetical protein MJO29_015539 [Puccinia striiformis f. sp. tritici]KAI7936968.1 hypothetical protein MJO28_015867 [Puccinia striiformis f. sp. tritici]
MISTSQTEEQQQEPRMVAGEEEGDKRTQKMAYDEIRLGKEIEAEHQLGLSNWIPLILVILPNLGAMFFDGEPESWRDSLLFLLIVYFLYKISKAPWQLYASARTTRILNQARMANRTGKLNKTIHPIQTQDQQYLTELKRFEMAYLLLATFSPILGISLLLYLQTKLDLGLEYLNSHSTVLYLLSSLIKPLGHLHHRLLQRTTYLQSQLIFPVRLSDQFNQSIDDLNFKLLELEQSSISKSALTKFHKEAIQDPLHEISTKLTKYQSEDELCQLRSATRLNSIEQNLLTIKEKLETTEESLQQLIKHDRSLHNTPLVKIVNEFLPSKKVNTHHPLKQGREEGESYLKIISRYIFNTPTLPSKLRSPQVTRAKPPKKIKAMIKVLMYPILKPISIGSKLIKRVISVPLKIIRLLSVSKQVDDTEQPFIRRRNIPANEDAHPSSSVSSSGTPSSTSPDSLNSDLDLLIDHHHPHHGHGHHGRSKVKAEPGIETQWDQNSRFFHDQDQVLVDHSLDHSFEDHHLF